MEGANNRSVMVGMSCPCKDCDKRYIGCHGKCSQYKEWRQNYTKQNEDIRHERHQKGIGWLGEHWRKPR